MRTYTGSTNCDDRAKNGKRKGKIMVNLLENCRDPGEIAKLNQQYVQNGKPPKYDISKADMNIYYETCKTEQEAFEHVFGESMERYNAGQKRNDRKTSMEKELAKLSKGKVQQELIHCMIAQVGNHESHPPVDECVEILQKYRERFVRQFPNMRIISCSIHLDELDDGTPHLQMYFIPVKTREQHEAMGNPKKWSGMDVQPSLTGALEQMGYTNDATVMVPKKDANGEPVLGDDGEPVMEQKHDYKNGAMAQWQKDFNGLLDEIALNHGITIDHYLRGKKVEHQDTRDYYAGKIDRETARALHNRDKADADLTNKLYEIENAKDEVVKLQADKAALKAEIKDLEGTVESAVKIIEKDFYKEADEHFSYYKRDRTRFEKDPAVYKAFEHARKMTRRTQNAWSKYRGCYTSFGRRAWAKTAIKLQQRTNEAWEEAKFIAEESKFQAAMKRKKAEIRKEVNELYKPHVEDFKKFCRTFDALSEEKKAKYREQFKVVEKKNKSDIKDMSKHLTRLFGSKSAMEYDKIKEVQQDRRSMNRMTNQMLKDIRQEAATGDDKSKDDDNDIYSIMADYDAKYKAANTKAPRAAKAAKAARNDIEALLEDGPEL